MFSTTGSFDVGLCTDRGLVRPDNQDALLVADTWLSERAMPLDQARALRHRLGTLYVVADGVGGGDDGAEASQIAATGLMEHFYFGAVVPEAPAERLRSAVRAANRALYTTSCERHREMGSTVVAALLHLDTLYIASVGDSSAWLFRHRMPACRLTPEHVLIDGQGQRRLTQAIGDADVEPALSTVPIEHDDVVVLCTDGITDSLNPTEMSRIARSSSARRATRALVGESNSRGGRDNSTAIVLRFSAAGSRSWVWLAWATLASLVALTGVLFVALVGALQNQTAPPEQVVLAASASTRTSESSPDLAPETPTREATPALPTSTIVPTATHRPPSPPREPSVVGHPSAYSPVTQALSTITAIPTLTLTPFPMLPSGVMPDVIGRPLAEVEAQLQQLGIMGPTVVDSQCRDKLGGVFDQFPAYTVVSSDPAPGAPLAETIILGVRAPDDCMTSPTPVSTP